MELIFNQVFTDKDPKPKERVHNGQPQGYSYDVLIDLNGHRKDFTVGFYDYDDEKWFFRDPDADESFEREHMKWFYLPLAELDSPQDKA